MQFVEGKTTYTWTEALALPANNSLHRAAAWYIQPRIDFFAVTPARVELARGRLFADGYAISHSYLRTDAATVDMTIPAAQHLSQLWPILESLRDQLDVVFWPFTDDDLVDRFIVHVSAGQFEITGCWLIAMPDRVILRQRRRDDIELTPETALATLDNELRRYDAVRYYLQIRADAAVRSRLRSQTIRLVGECGPDETASIISSVAVLREAVQPLLERCNIGEAPLLMQLQLLATHLALQPGTETVLQLADDFTKLGQL